MQTSLTDQQKFIGELMQTYADHSCREYVILNDVASTIASLRFQQAAEISKEQKIFKKKEFIKEHLELFTSIIKDTPKYHELIETIRREFNYSPRTVSCDIWSSWRKLVEKVKTQC